ncbi:MAG: polymer-forming cytoskeletal protein [Candidatus Atribacteria bacterium]|nr:polymer-forming cytoskeletal protein [Candidatus Atribacteria bacterium]
MNLIKSHENVKDIAILGDQTRLDGHYQGEGTVMIQGEFHGSIDSMNIIITRHGQSNAFIQAKNLEIWGTLAGFTRTEKVICRSSCRITGIIMSNGIAIEPGTTFEGGLTFPQTGDSGEK